MIVQIFLGETIISYVNLLTYPHKVKEYLLESPAPRWKHLPDGKNFVEYWDCRHSHMMDRIL